MAGDLENKEAAAVISEEKAAEKSVENSGNGQAPESKLAAEPKPEGSKAEAPRPASDGPRSDSRRRKNQKRTDVACLAEASSTGAPTARTADGS